MADDSLNVSVYAVRDGWKPGLYTKPEAAINAMRGYPHSQFEVFDSLEKADEYLCTYMEVARPVLEPEDQNAVYVAVEAMGQSGATSEVVAGIGAFSHHRYANNMCIALKAPTSREKAEIVALERVIKDAAGEKKTIHMFGTQIHDVVLTRLNTDEEKELSTLPIYCDLAAELKSLADAIKTSSVTVIRPKNTGGYQARMALYLARKAAIVIARLSVSPPAAAST